MVPLTRRSGDGRQLPLVSCTTRGNRSVQLACRASALQPPIGASVVLHPRQQPRRIVPDFRSRDLAGARRVEHLPRARETSPRKPRPSQLSSIVVRVLAVSPLAFCAACLYVASVEPFVTLLRREF